MLSEEMKRRTPYLVESCFRVAADSGVGFGTVSIGLLERVQNSGKGFLNPMMQWFSVRE
jgi:hypothetical protein